ncbi:MAG TPA: hypothetical protein VFO19_04145, partial [Vicinamibacterales bacterium]|nr:hypothetical protein [Vicinamibacterales bacterium]
AHDGQKQFAEAAAEYQRALEASPGAQTAEIALATALARGGHRAEAAALAEASLTRTDASFDPWLAYGQGDLRKWPAIIAAVRKAAQ